MVCTNLSDMIGSTPLLRCDSIKRSLGLDADIFAKAEFFNPAGSVKDRVALSMINDMEKSGRLGAGGTIIEPTSGNTGIGLAAIGASRGYKVVLVMPETMSIERRRLAAAYGARVVLTAGARGMAGAIERAEELKEEIPGSVIAGQFENPANPAAHYASTGPEIWREMGGDITAFVAGIGTGGTISGAGRYLKEQNAGIKIVGVEPAGSPVLTQGRSGAHGIQGIGAGFVPETLDRSVLAEVLTCTDENAFEYARLLAKTQGMLCGISSGCALWAAVELAGRAEYAGGRIDVLLPDTGERYLSSGVFAKE